MKKKTISDIAHPQYSALKTMRTYMRVALIISWIVLILGIILSIYDKTK